MPQNCHEKNDNVFPMGFVVDQFFGQTQVVPKKTWHEATRVSRVPWFITISPTLRTPPTIVRWLYLPLLFHKCPINCLRSSHKIAYGQSSSISYIHLCHASYISYSTIILKDIPIPQKFPSFFPCFSPIPQDIAIDFP